MTTVANIIYGIDFMRLPKHPHSFMVTHEPGGKRRKP
jgi:hypothetical protein